MSAPAAFGRLPSPQGTQVPGLPAGPDASLLGRRTWHREAVAQVDRAARLGEPLSIVIVNLDGFRLVNDTHGRKFGDKVLHRVGQCIRAVVDGNGLIARRGQEFFLLLPRTQEEDACRLAERTRQAISCLRQQAPDGTRVQVTACAGLTSIGRGPACQLPGLLSAADSALCAAKQANAHDQEQGATGGRVAYAPALQGVPARRRQQAGGRVVLVQAVAPPQGTPAAPSAARLLAVAACVLPLADRSRYAEEFRAELQDIARSGDGRGPQWRYAIRQFTAALRLRGELREAQRQQPAR